MPMRGDSIEIARALGNIAYGLIGGWLLAILLPPILDSVADALRLVDHSHPAVLRVLGELAVKPLALPFSTHSPTMVLVLVLVAVLHAVLLLFSAGAVLTLVLFPLYGFWVLLCHARLVAALPLRLERYVGLYSKIFFIGSVLGAIFSMGVRFGFNPLSAEQSSFFDMASISVPAALLFVAMAAFFFMNRGSEG